MKNMIPFFLFFLLLLSCNKRERVIYNPEFDNSNSNLHQISKIELTDTATILYMDTYYYPDSRVKILSGTVLRGKQKVYELLRSEGLELDKEVYIPESGNVSFKLFFEPVEEHEESVDFIEHEDNLYFKIFGIKLYEGMEPEKAVRCVLKGEVIDRPYSSRLVLSKEGEDIRTAKVVYIPIHNGTFEYILNCDSEESYEFTFYDEYIQGSWRICPFIAENGVIHFTLYPREGSEENMVKGGTLNEEKNTIDRKISEMYKRLGDEQNQLISEGRFYNKEATELRNRIEKMDVEDPQRDGLIEKYNVLSENGANLTDEAKVIRSKFEEASIESEKIKLQYAKENPTIVGYSMVVQEIRIVIQQAGIPGWPVTDITPMVDLYKNIYKDKYPDHPYTLKMENMLTGESVKTGSAYIDVSAMDLEGRDVKLSDLIDGKVAMIHLWASWCGPCRRHGKELIPIYEKYKDKGFTVVGIARENNRETMIAARENDGYPWQDLLELNDRGFIWAKYGLSNAGGGDFLVDAQGKIIAISPTPDEINNILESILNSK